MSTNLSASATLDLSETAARRAMQRVASVAALDTGQVIDRFARAIWSVVTEPGDAVAGALIREFGAADALRRVSSPQRPVSMLVPAADEAEAHGRWLPRMSPALVERGLLLAARDGVRHIVPSDPGWPLGLDHLGDHQPVSLWVRGDDTAGDGSVKVALVGARAASSYGQHVATELGAELAGAGLTVVSGAAYGIDGAAHRAALRAGGRTVAFVAGGVDRDYPVGHTELFADITRNGAIISEVPCGTAPTRWRFLRRNRLIAAASAGTVVVEAGGRSGSLNTAGHAAELGRPLGAVPGQITSASSAGCHRLLRDYDAVCITSADDVRELLCLDATPTLPGMGVDDSWTNDSTRVRDALSQRSSRSTEQVARLAGMSVAAVEALLGVMSISGEAHRDGSGWRRV